MWVRIVCVLCPELELGGRQEPQVAACISSTSGPGGRGEVGRIGRAASAWHLRPIPTPALLLCGVLPSVWLLLLTQWSTYSS